MDLLTADELIRIAALKAATSERFPRNIPLHERVLGMEEYIRTGSTERL